MFTHDCVGARRDASVPSPSVPVDASLSPEFYWIIWRKADKSVAALSHGRVSHMLLAKRAGENGGDCNDSDGHLVRLMAVPIQ